MTTVLISGWNYGFQKVKFSLLMKSELGLTLYPAKQITNRSSMATSSNSKSQTSRSTTSSPR